MIQGRRGGRTREPVIVRELVRRLSSLVCKELNYMQVCGTHTWSFYHHGLNALIPSKLHLIAGPGCPVCVTAQGDVDAVLELVQEKNTVVATFGDLMRVPGRQTTLANLKAAGRDVRVLRSPLDAVHIAVNAPDKRVILLAVGFETTAPTIAAAVQTASSWALSNFSVVLLTKRLLAAMPVLLREASIDGILCPGHVAAVTGSDLFVPVVNDLEIPGVIAGFEPVDILCGLLELVRLSGNHQVCVSNQYPRVVTRKGNLQAKRLIDDTFDQDKAEWRGFGTIAKTGDRLKKKLQRYELRLENASRNSHTPLGCLCDQVTLGRVHPRQCPHFGRVCTPESPVGPCMVTSEGTCAACYLLTPSISLGGRRHAETNNH